MPAVLTMGSITLFFTSYDCYEPMHIHIIDGNKECKYWLRADDEIILADNRGFSRSELLKLKKVVIQNYQDIKKLWDEHCKDTTRKKYK